MVSKISFLTFISLLIFFCNSCNRDEERYPYDKDGLTYKDKLEYNGNIKLEGFYLFKNSDASYLMYYFWDNGYLFRGGGRDSSIALSDSKCRDIESKGRELPFSWGCFIIEDNILKLQTYDPVSRNRYPEFKVEEYWAIIKNDSTLYFYKSIRPWGEAEVLDRTYHFQKCDNKPDSLNILMEN